MLHIIIFLCLWSAISSFSQTLQARIQERVSQEFPGATIGFSLRSIQTGYEIADLDGDSSFIPASTLKILTTAAAFEFIPLNWSPQTTLALYGSRQGRTFSGQIHVIGGGDPNISGRFSKDFLQVPNAMADSIRQWGIDTLRAVLIADTSYFSDPSIPPTWSKHATQAWYGAKPSALSFNDNVVSVRVSAGKRAKDSVQIQTNPSVMPFVVVSDAQTVKGRKSTLSWKYQGPDTILVQGTIGIKAAPAHWVIPVEDPPRYFLKALQVAMQSRGLVWLQDSLAKSSPTTWKQASFTTAPLLSIIHEVNQRSQNLHAELLLRALGKHYKGTASMANGFLAMKALLTKLGLDSHAVTLADGSGLSASNRIKPSLITSLLAKMISHPAGQLYIHSFASPGAPGSAIRRLDNLDVAYQIRIKTGFIDGVQSLVGYIGLSTGDTLAASLFLNNYRGSNEKARALMDTLWSWIATEYNWEHAAQREARILYNEADSLKDYRHRLEYFSRRLLDRPYLLGPTGEGAVAELEKKPRMNLSSFDCVTYLEHAMALATAPHADSVFSTLQRIRYFSETPVFSTRKHYFVEDWIGKAPQWATLMRVPGDTVVIREMDKRAFFQSHKIPWEGINPQTTIPYLPYDLAIEWSKKWKGPATIFGVGFMAKGGKICVTHTGLLIAEPGKPILLRHASQLQKKTFQQDLSEYLLQRKGKTPGIVLYEIHNGHIPQ